MPKPLRGLIVGAELTPLAKVGGLGDYMGALPKALTRWMEAAAAIPYHETIRPHAHGFKKIAHVTVPFVGGREKVTIWQGTIPQSSVKLFLLENNRYLSRGSIYNSRKVWDPISRRLASSKKRDIIRYSFFCQALFAWLQTTAKQWDVVHANDWHMAPLLALLKTDPVTADLKTLLTIHNVDVSLQATQHPLGLSGPYLRILPPALLAHINWREAKHQRSIRVFELGLQTADHISTVSPQYAQELLTPAYGHGLEHILRQRRQQFSAILNGIDTAVFNPATDPALFHHYSARTAKNKVVNKVLLKQRLQLDSPIQRPLLGMVARIIDQKGLRLVLAALPALKQLGVDVVISGEGDQMLERRLKAAQRRYSSWFYFYNRFDITLSQRVYAASDMFLMPSAYEPCGLSQLIAMRYGSIPIVHGTGGLKNTVFPHRNGFVFFHYTTNDFVRSLTQAITLYRNNPKRWQNYIQQAMRNDTSWVKPARRYYQLYRKITAYPKRTKRRLPT